MALATVDSAKIDAVNAAVQTLTTDTSAALADIAAQIKALQGTLPNSVANTELDNILSKVQAVDASIKAADPGQVLVEPPLPPAQ